MLDYIYDKDCKRAKLLQYFEESKANKLEECCSSCGIKKEKLIEEINKRAPLVKSNKKSKKVTSWQTIFNSLYNKS